MAVKTSVREMARLKRKMRIRKKLKGSTERPRLSVFRTDKHMYAQVIDDVHGNTLVTASTVASDYRELGIPKGKVEAAKQVGQLVARKARASGITKVVFDRNGFIYHGRIRALADAAREAGLEF